MNLESTQRKKALSTRAGLPAAGTALLVLLAAGCSLVAEPASETARIELGGAAGTEVRLVISTRFEPSSTGTPNDVQLLDADTLRARLPFARDYDISRERRFFAQAARIETADAGAQPASSLRMRAFIDGRERYDEELLPEDSRALRFTFIYACPAAAVAGGGENLFRVNPEHGRRSR